MGKIRLLMREKQTGGNFMTTGNFFMTFWHSGLNYQSHDSDHKQNLSLAEVGCFITAFRAVNVLIMELKEKQKFPI